MLLIPQYLYHGTSLPRLNSILSQGLVPEPQKNGEARICLTDDIEVARFHGKCMAQWDKDATPKKERKIKFKTTILKIPTNILSPNGYLLEEGFLHLGVSAGKAKGRVLLNEKENWTWQELFQETGTIGYKCEVTSS